MGGGSTSFPLLPLNYVNKQETESLTESVLPRLVRGLPILCCFSAERRHMNLNEETGRRKPEAKGFLFLDSMGLGCVADWSWSMLRAEQWR